MGSIRLLYLSRCGINKRLFDPRRWAYRAAIINDQSRIENGRGSYDYRCTRNKPLRIEAYSRKDPISRNPFSLVQPATNLVTSRQVVLQFTFDQSRRLCVSSFRQWQIIHLRFHKPSGDLGEGWFVRGYEFTAYEIIAIIECLNHTDVSGRRHDLMPVGYFPIPLLCGGLVLRSAASHSGYKVAHNASELAREIFLSKVGILDGIMEKAGDNALLCATLFIV